MKKILLILVIIIYLFACNSVDDSKTKPTALDSMQSDVTTNTQTACATGDSSQIGYWEIDSATAVEMVKNVGMNPPNSNIHFGRAHIDKKIKDSFKTNYIGLIPARYRLADVDRYSTKRCIASNDSAGMVAQFFTKIVKVKAKKQSKPLTASSYTYYDIVTIKPPPYEK